MFESLKDTSIPISFGAKPRKPSQPTSLRDEGEEEFSQSGDSHHLPSTTPPSSAGDGRSIPSGDIIAEEEYPPAATERRAHKDEVIPYGLMESAALDAGVAAAFVEAMERPTAWQEEELRGTLGPESAREEGDAMMEFSPPMEQETPVSPPPSPVAVREEHSVVVHPTVVVEVETSSNREGTAHMDDTIPFSVAGATAIHAADPTLALYRENKEETASTRDLAGDIQQLPHHEQPSDFYTDGDQLIDTLVGSESYEEEKQSAPAIQLVEQENLPEPILLERERASVEDIFYQHEEELKGEEGTHNDEFSTETIRVIEPVPSHIRQATPSYEDSEEEEGEMATSRKQESSTSFDTDASEVTVVAAHRGDEEPPVSEDELTFHEDKPSTPTTGEGMTQAGGDTRYLTRSLYEQHHYQDEGVKVAAGDLDDGRPLVSPIGDDNGTIVDSEEVSVGHNESEERQMTPSPVLHHRRQSLAMEENGGDNQRSSSLGIGSTEGPAEKNDYVIVDSIETVEPQHVAVASHLTQLDDIELAKEDLEKESDRRHSEEDVGGYEFVQSEDVDHEVNAAHSSEPREVVSLHSPDDVGNKILVVEDKPSPPEELVEGEAFPAYPSGVTRVTTPPPSPSMEEERIVESAETHITPGSGAMDSILNFSARVADEITNRLSSEDLSPNRQQFPTAAEGCRVSEGDEVLKNFKKPSVEMDDKKVASLVDDVLGSVVAEALAESEEAEDDGEGDEGEYSPELGHVIEELEDEDDDDELADIEDRAELALPATVSPSQQSSSLLTTSIGLPSIPRPRSPVPPRAVDRDDCKQQLIQTQQQRMEQDSSPEEERLTAGLVGRRKKSSPDSASRNSSSASSSLRRGMNGGHANQGEVGSGKFGGSGGDISEGGGSLKEFERLELEIQQRRQTSTTSAAELEEKLMQSGGASISGSASSLTEFESIEKEVREAVAQSVADDIMMLSDIREESEEADEEERDERMSTREDDGEGDDKGESTAQMDDGADEVDSLSGSMKKQQSGGGHKLAGEEFSPLIQDAMLSSIDSLEAAASAAIVDRQSGSNAMDTSSDSLEARGGRSSNLTSQGGVGSRRSHPIASPHHHEDEDYLQQAREADVYNSDERDSLDEAIGVSAFPTTLTTFETIQLGEDGSRETITRRVVTRVVDPIHSRVRFTGTENEDQLRNIHDGKPRESVDAEGNITTVTRQIIPSVVHQ